jgi:hypothetical protein
LKIIPHHPRSSHPIHSTITSQFKNPRQNYYKTIRKQTQNCSKQPTDQTMNHEAQQLDRTDVYKYTNINWEAPGKALHLPGAARRQRAAICFVVCYLAMLAGI